MRHLFSGRSPIALVLGFLVAFLAATTNLTAQESDCDQTRYFCADTINSGLGQPPLFMDRQTPRATMESFIQAARAENWDAAAHVLNLSELPEDMQVMAGPRLAEQLHVVIQRKAVIQWDNLSDRPDALDARASSEEAMAGEPRRSLLLWTLDLEMHPVSIRLHRVSAPEEPPVWLFSSQTIAEIPALYALYSPTAFEQQLPEALMGDGAFGLMWWELIMLPIVLLLAAVVGRFVWKGMSWISRSTRSGLVTDVTKVGRGPAATGAATGILLFFGSHVLVFSGAITTVLTPLAWLGLLAAGVWLAINVVEVVLDRLLEFEHTDLTPQSQVENRAVATRIAAARRIFVVLIALFGGGLFLSQTNLFQNLGLTVLGTAGALTLVLGFAARRVLGNIMASLQIALNQSARIGDRIVYKDYLCHVERINFTFVQLRDWDGTRLVVPVEEFANTPFENWSMKEPEMLRIIKLKFAHDADVSALRDVFDEVIEGLDHEHLGDLTNAKVRVAGQDVFGKEIWFALPCADPNTSWDISCLARERLIARANEIAAREDVVMFPDVTPAEAA